MLEPTVTIMTREVVGLILRVVDYKESSVIMHLLTNDKIESIICRGIKKINSKHKGFVLSYNYVKCIITDKTIPTLTDIDLIESYQNIQENINKFKYAGLIINMLYKEKYDNNKIYDLALKTLKYINNDDEEYYYNVFLLKNLHFIGLGLNKDNINNVIGYNIKESCIITKDSNLSYDINKDDTITIFNLYYAKLEEKVDCNLKMVNDFLKEYYLIHASMKI